MRICYVDESGDTGAIPSPTSPVQPVLVIAGVILDHQYLTPLTHAFINLKQRFSPQIAANSPHRLDSVLNEMKGNDIRRSVVSARRRESRRGIGFLDRFMDLLEFHRVKIIGRVWVKQLQYQMDGQAVFTSSVQAICKCFQEHLDHVRDNGIVIADSRMPQQNMPVAHAVFTQKFKIGGDSFPRIWEMPTFGHSNNHVGLQVADILASSLLFPISAFAYCTGHITNQTHVKPGYELLRDRYGDRLKALQFRYQVDGKRCGGITVSDGMGHKNGAHLFSNCASRIAAAATQATPPLHNPIVIPPIAPFVPNSDPLTSPLPPPPQTMP